MGLALSFCALTAKLTDLDTSTCELCFQGSGFQASLSGPRPKSRGTEGLSLPKGCARTSPLTLISGEVFLFQTQFQNATQSC